MLTDEERQLIYEQIASARLTASASQREAKAQEIRNALLVQISEDAARLAEQLPAVLQNYHSLAATMAAIDEKLEDLHARQGAIDQTNKLILELERGQLGNISNKRRRQELERQIDEAQVSLETATGQRQLARQISNLNYLQEQAATYGARVPLELVNQITDLEELIQHLQAELRQG